MVVYNQGMIITIIAGGSGTRLWPLSQSNYPKHLLKLTGENSLLQNTYSRSATIADEIYVVTEASHADEVQNQLPDLKKDNIIVEPARRGTASCILLALTRIKQYHDSSIPVVFLHADHHISAEESFQQTVTLAAKNSSDHQVITLIGIKPTYPATGFGYIELGEKIGSSHGTEIHRAAQFKEKPKAATAKKYMESGNFLWNMGLFAAPEQVFAKTMQNDTPELYERYLKLQQAGENIHDAYLELPSEPIDTALIEKASKLEVVAGSFDWADIGSFFDLHKILQDKDSNSLSGDIELIDSDDVMVHGSDKPIVVIGLSGIVVVDSPDGLLVCSKEKSQLVGEAAKKIQARNPKS